ncbi:IS66 family transposase, partial [Halomonas llamarensis]
VRLRNIAHAQRRRAHHAAALALEGHITRLSDACPDVVNGSLTRNGIMHAGCWAHARRKFIEAQKVQPKGKTGKADWVINQMGKL